MSNFVKKPFTYKETAVYLVSEKTDFRPKRIDGFWKEHNMFYDALNNLYYSEHYNIFSSFEEAKQVSLEIINQKLNGIKKHLASLQAEQLEIEKLTRFSYNETLMYAVFEDSETFPYISGIEKVNGEWVTAADQPVEPKVEFIADDETQKIIREYLGPDISNEVLVFKIEGRSLEKAVPDENLFHTYEEAKQRAQDMLIERQANMSKKISDLQKLWNRCGEIMQQIYTGKMIND